MFGTFDTLLSSRLLEMIPEIQGISPRNEGFLKKHDEKDVEWES